MIKMKKTIGIVFADALEYKPFIEYFEKDIMVRPYKRGNEGAVLSIKKAGSELEIHAVKCGIGKVNAASAASFLIADDRAEIILNAGLSGAVKDVRREDMILGSSYVETDFDVTALGRKLGEKPDQEYIYSADSALLDMASRTYQPFKVGRFGSGDTFLADGEKKKMYAEIFDIFAMDMESSAIASVCKKAEIPFLSIRRISDSGEDSASGEYREMNEREEKALSMILEKMFYNILETLCEN